MTTCGFCGGGGRVPAAQRDACGPRPDYPAERACEYCGGAGVCEGGDKLLAAGPAYRCDDEDRARAGLPPWA